MFYSPGSRGFGGLGGVGLLPPLSSVVETRLGGGGLLPPLLATGGVGLQWFGFFIVHSP